MIYLDNAATSFPKPARVAAEVQECLCRYCGNPGRGAHPLALACAERVYACREAVSDFLGLGAPERILFVQNTTHALNLAIKGLLQSGEHVLISELEHNAVRRPLHRLCTEQNVSYDTFPVLEKSTEQILCALSRLLKPQTSAIICTHASNICSLSLPLVEIGKFCHLHGLKFIVDAAQSAGHLPLDMRAMQIDALALPGHKALYGIQGVGVLALGAGILPTPLFEGGSGSDSLSPTMPAEPPERFEAGTLSTPAIVSLWAGLQFLREHGVQALAEQEKALFRAARERLESIPDVTVYAPQEEGAVLLFNRAALPATRVAEQLAARGICVRAGLHCAPLAHKALQTPEGGAVRVSFGAFNTLQDVDALWHALK